MDPEVAYSLDNVRAVMVENDGHEMNMCQMHKHEGESTISLKNFSPLLQRQCASHR